MSVDLDPSDWIESTVEEIYYSTIHGKWDDVRKRIWITDDNVRYQISATNVADLYDPTADGVNGTVDDGNGDDGAESAKSSQTKRIRATSLQDNSPGDDSHSEQMNEEPCAKRTCVASNTAVLPT